MKAHGFVGPLGLFLLTATGAHAQTITCDTLGDRVTCWETGKRYQFASPAADAADAIREAARQQDEARRQQQIHEMTMWGLQLQNQALMSATLAKPAPVVAIPPVVATPPPAPSPLVIAVPLTPAQIVAAERAAIRKRLGITP